MSSNDLISSASGMTATVMLTFNTDFISTLSEVFIVGLVGGIAGLIGKLFIEYSVEKIKSKIKSKNKSSEK